MGHTALHVSCCLEYHEIALRILGKELFELQGRSGADIDLHARKHRLEPMGVIQTVGYEYDLFALCHVSPRLPYST